MKGMALLVMAMMCACGVESIKPPLHYDREIAITLLFHGEWTDAAKADVTAVLNDLTPSGYLDGLATYGLHPNVHVGGHGWPMLVQVYSPAYMPGGDAWHTWSDLDTSIEISIGGAWTSRPTMIAYALSHEVAEAIYNPAALDEALEIADKCQTGAHQWAQFQLGGAERTVATYVDASGACVP